MGGKLDLLHLARGSKQVGLRPTETMSQGRQASPRLFGSRIHASRNSSDQNEVARVASWSSSDRHNDQSMWDIVQQGRRHEGGKQARLCPTRMKSRGRQATPHSLGSRIQVSQTSLTGMKMRGRLAGLRPTDTRSQASGTSSNRNKIAWVSSWISLVKHEDLSKRHFVRTE